jgi:hypothetical protein
LLGVVVGKKWGLVIFRFIGGGSCLIDVVDKSISCIAWQLKVNLINGAIF